MLCESSPVDAVHARLLELEGADVGHKYVSSGFVCVIMCMSSKRREHLRSAVEPVKTKNSCPHRFLRVLRRSNHIKSRTCHQQSGLNSAR